MELVKQRSYASLQHCSPPPQVRCGLTTRKWATRRASFNAKLAICRTSSASILTSPQLNIWNFMQAYTQYQARNVTTLSKICSNWSTCHRKGKHRSKRSHAVCNRDFAWHAHWCLTRRCCYVVHLHQGL